MTTECAHCSETMHLEIDSSAHCKVAEAGADPIVFVPRVDFSKLPDRCITDAF